MINARDELLKILDGKSISCATITYGCDYADDEDRRKYNLKTGYSSDDLAKFLKSLSFNYDNGYGGQNLYGTVWLEDKTWLERGEYDGSEWWEHKVAPEIPSDLWR